MQSDFKLSQFAMLATCRVSQFAGRKLDRKATDETLAANNAGAFAGRFNKQIIGKAALAEITRTVSDLRSTHYKRTLPWADAGPRLLSCREYLNYCQAMNPLIDRFAAAKSRFIANYPDYIEAQRAELGRLFNSADYPNAGEIARKFSAAIDFDPAPDAGDFRADVANDAADAIRAGIETRANAALAEAMREPFRRIADAARAMTEKLGAFKPAAGKGDKAEGVFRDSLVENVRELVALLPGLNITGDAKLSEIGARLAELCQHDADALRESDSIRANVAAKAEKILADVSALIA